MAGEQSSSQQHNQCEKGIIGFGFSSMDPMPILESNSAELFNLTTGMEMLAFPPNKIRYANSIMWKEYFTKPDASSSNTQGGGGGGGSSSLSRDHFYQVAADHEFNYRPTDFTTTDNLWQQQPNSNSNRFSSMVDDSSSFGYVFPCEGEGGGSREIMRSEGLSLSLCPNNKSSSMSTIGDQLIRGTNSSTATQLLHHQRHDQVLRQQDRFFGMGAATLHQPPHIQVKDSKYLVPCQDLLNEFCDMGTKRNTDQHHHPQNNYKNKINKKEDENAGDGRSSTKQSSSSVDFLELQKRKSKLVSMLEEVDRRYRQYCEQMKSVVSSFEAVVRAGAGSVYSALAAKAMSRHFRCLRDAIVVQIKETEKVMGETTDPIAVALGSTRGETPRLRLLDQTHRRQSAFRQMNIMETHPWRPQRGLPERSVSLLRAWLFEHFLHPYPTDVDKHILARQTGLSKGQVSNWFINARVRLWKPMVEEMYLEETKEQSLQGESSAHHGENSTHELPYQEHKPTPDQLVRGDTGSLSSIINPQDKSKRVKNGRNHVHNQQQQIRRDTDMFSAMDLDFSSYNDQTSNAISYTSNFGNGVSLTLGLQQHGETGSGVNLSSFPSPSQHSAFYPRDHIEECEQLKYSILDGEVQNPQYRNLMGVQLLHDLGE